MVLDDSFANRFRAQAELNSTRLKDLYVPLHQSASANSHHIVPTLSTKTQRCSYANHNPSACTGHSTKRDCSSTRGCEWNSAGATAKCVPTSCSCTVQSETALSSCSRHRNRYACTTDADCKWDAEFHMCSPNANLWHVAMCLIPVVLAVQVLIYYFMTQADSTRLWFGSGLALPKLYRASMWVALLAFGFLVATIQFSRQHIDNRRRFAKPTLLILAGAVLTPSLQALHLLRDWSRNWVMLGLLVTSGATMWFVGEFLGVTHLKSADNTRLAPPTNNTRAFGQQVKLYQSTPYPSAGNTLNVLSTIGVLLLLFHVLVVDNLGWWLLYDTD